MINSNELNEYKQMTKRVSSEVSRLFKQYCDVSGEYYGYGVTNWSITNDHIHITSLVTTRDPTCGHEHHQLPLAWLTLSEHDLTHAIQQYKKED